MSIALVLLAGIAAGWAIQALREVARHHPADYPDDETTADCDQRTKGGRRG
jgi:hypothetical protein